MVGLRILLTACPDIIASLENCKQHAICLRREKHLVIDCRSLDDVDDNQEYVPLINVYSVTWFLR